jgi:hypothetical protein
VLETNVYSMLRHCDTRALLSEPTILTSVWVIGVPVCRSCLVQRARRATRCRSMCQVTYEAAATSRVAVLKMLSRQC